MENIFVPLAHRDQFLNVVKVGEPLVFEWLRSRVGLQEGQ